MVWSPTGSGNVHVDQVLTNISLGWPTLGLVGERLFPVVRVRKQSDKYRVFGREAWLPETSDYRAPGTEANEVPGMALSLDTYYAQEHSLQTPVTDEERENSDNDLSPDRDGTELVTGKIMLGREVMMKNLVTTAANYATGMSTTLVGGAQWSAYSTSDPIGNIRTAVRAIHAKVFLEPNLAVIPYLVMSYLEDHPDIIERIKYSERAILTPEIIASVFGLQNVIVPGVGIGSGAPGAAGNAISVGYLWGDDVLLAWVPPRAGLRIPAFAYEFTWTYGGAEQVVDRWREERRKSDLIRVSRRYDLKMVGVEINPASGDFGKSITGYLIKDVLA
jgi:hypothetical protein